MSPATRRLGLTHNAGGRTEEDTPAARCKRANRRPRCFRVWMPSHWVIAQQPCEDARSQACFARGIQSKCPRILRYIFIAEGVFSRKSLTLSGDYPSQSAGSRPVHPAVAAPPTPRSRSAPRHRHNRRHRRRNGPLCRRRPCSPPRAVSLDQAWAPLASRWLRLQGGLRPQTAGRQ